MNDNEVIDTGGLLLQGETKTITFEPMEVDFDQENENLLNVGRENSETNNLSKKSNLEKIMFLSLACAIPVFYFTLGFLLKFPA